MAIVNLHKELNKGKLEALVEIYEKISEPPRSKLRGIQFFKKLSSPLMGED